MFFIRDLTAFGDLFVHTVFLYSCWTGILGCYQISTTKNSSQNVILQNENVLKSNWEALLKIENLYAASFLGEVLKHCCLISTRERGREREKRERRERERQTENMKINPHILSKYQLTSAGWHWQTVFSPKMELGMCGFPFPLFFFKSFFPQRGPGRISLRNYKPT